jgi:hypothetical protein
MLVLLLKLACLEAGSARTMIILLLMPTLSAGKISAMFVFLFKLA